MAVSKQVGDFSEIVVIGNTGLFSLVAILAKIAKLYIFTSFYLLLTYEMSMIED